MREEKPSIIKHDILLRIRLLYLAFIVVAVVIFGRLIWVQFGSREVADNAVRLHDRIFITEPLPAHRGSILARNGEPFATSIFRYQVSFDFGSDGLDSTELYLQNADSLAILLADFFKDRPAKAYSDYFRRMRKEHYRLVHPRDSLRPRPQGFLARWFSDPKYDTLRVYDTVRDNRPVDILPRPVDWSEWQTLRKFPLLNWNMGIVYRLDCYDSRIYPKGDLARRTIGKFDDRGHQYGVEYAWRDELMGRDGKAVYQRIARRFSGRVAGADHVDPVDGLDVVTTLDADLQDIADRALRRQMIAQNAKWGTAIVMETATGEILALANCGRNKDGSYFENENYALKECVEPGSTFKLATVLTLLDDAGFDPATTYDTGDGSEVVIIPHVSVKDSHRGDHAIALERAVEASSNVYFAKAVYDRYGSDRKRMAEYGAYLRDHLHLSDAYGLERLGEVKPRIVQDWETVGDPGGKLIRMAYGYRVQMTPMQVLTFYNAVANNGCMMAPMLVRGLSRNGEMVERYEPRVIARSIASDRALKTVRGYLQRVCTHGTASAYFQDTTHLRVAAKTGTARITDPDHFQQYFYLGSLVAFFPAENPRYTVITSIMTEMQAGRSYYGASLSGPVTKQLVDYISNREIDWYRDVERSSEKRWPDRIKGGEISRVREVAGKVARRVEYDQRKGWGTVTVDSLSEVHVRSISEPISVMPDVRGMGLRDALFLLESRGLQVRFTGVGAVCQQTPASGTAIRSGQQVSISLE